MAVPTSKKLAEMLKAIFEGIKLPPLPPPELFNKLIELNSDVPLPYGWEQRLNIQTGDIYYVNKVTGERTNEDLCKARDFFKTYFYSSTFFFSSEFNSAANNSGAYVDEGKSFAITTTASSSREAAAKPSNYLVVVGCVACHTYMMVEKGTKECPRCKGEVKSFQGKGCV